MVLVWRLDRWGRSVTDLLATLQELEHLGVGFVSLTEALDLTTPAGRAMAGLLAIFAQFEREILRERTRAGLAHARQNGKRLGRPATAAVHAEEIRKLHRAGVSKSEIARRLRIGRTSVRRIMGGSHENPRESLSARDNRIHNEAIADANGPEEQVMGWHCYLDDKIRFPFQARCIGVRDTFRLSQKRRNRRGPPYGAGRCLLRRYARTDPLAGPDDGSSIVPTGGS